MAFIPTKVLNKELEKIVEQNLKRRTARTTVKSALEGAFKDAEMGTKEFVNENMVTRPSQRGTNRTMSSETTLNKVFKSPESIAQQNSISLSDNEFKSQLFRKSRADATAAFTSPEFAAQNMSRELRSPTKNLTNEIAAEKAEKAANTIGDSNFKFTRYGGKTTGVKNPLTDFEKVYNDEFKNISENEKGFVPKDEGLRSAMNMDKVLNSLKDKGYSGDVNKFNKLINDASSFRKSIKDGNVTFDAGTVAKKENKPGKMDKVLSKAIPMAVGGGLIFSMFNRGGQMSNSELYGQSTPYSGGGGY